MDEVKVRPSIEQRGMFVPVKAMLVYQNKGNNSYNSTQSYVSAHAIRDGEVCEGHPMSKKDLTELCKIVMPHVDMVIDYIPERLISYTPSNKYGSMLWWKPACEQSLFFKVDGIKSGKAPVPATLFAVINGSLHVWALKTRTRPDLDTPVYKPPYFNMFDNGVCMGNIDTPRKVHPKDIEIWEAAYFRGTFTSEGNEQLKGITLRTLWKHLMNGKYQNFPGRYLQPSGTVRDVVKLIKKEVN